MKSAVIGALVVVGDYTLDKINILTRNENHIHTALEKLLIELFVRRQLVPIKWELVFWVGNLLVLNIFQLKIRALILLERADLWHGTN